MDAETFLASLRNDNVRALRYGPGDVVTLDSVRASRPHGLRASILNGARPRGSEQSFNQRVAWANAKQGQSLSAADDDFLLDGAMRHISMSIQDGTRSKYDTALSHFRKFMDMHGYNTDILYIDMDSQEEKDFARRFFLRFAEWLCLVGKNRQRVVGLMSAESISTYIALIFIITNVETNGKVDLDFITPSLKRLYRGRQIELIDLNKRPIKRKKVGLTVTDFETFDKLGYRFEDRSFMSKEMKDLCRRIGEEEIFCIWEASSKFQFGAGHRKCEVTVKDINSFFIGWAMTRASIRWFNQRLEEVPPETNSLRALYEKRAQGGHAEGEPSSTKADLSGSIYGQTRTIHPLSADGELVVDPGNAICRYEIRVPEPHHDRRKNMFIFSFSDGTPLTASIFCEILYHMLWRAAKLSTQPMTLEQIIQEYSGHSARIGAVNCMREAVLEDGSKWTYEERLSQGRFRSSNHSTAMYVYNRSNAPRLIKCMKAMLCTRINQGQTIASDLPVYRLSHALPEGQPGTYITKAGELPEQGNRLFDPTPGMSKIEMNNRNELKSILELQIATGERKVAESEVAKRFLVPTGELKDNGKRKREGRYWKGVVEKVVMGDRFPVKVKFEDGMTEEWDIDEFRKGRSTFRQEYPEEWAKRFPFE